MTEPPVSAGASACAPEPNDLTRAAIDKLMAGPVAAVRPPPLPGVIPPSVAIPDTWSPP